MFYKSSFDIQHISQYNRLKSYNNSEVEKRMTKQELIVKFAEKEDLAHADSRFVIDMLFDNMERSLIKGERVEIRGFGSFKIKEYASYTGRNPRSGEKTKVKSKKLPVFKVGKELRERVDIQ